MTEAMPVWWCQDRLDVQCLWDEHTRRHRDCVPGECPVEQAIVRVNIALEDMEG